MNAIEHVQYSILVYFIRIQPVTSVCCTTAYQSYSGSGSATAWIDLSELVVPIAGCPTAAATAAALLVGIVGIRVLLVVAEDEPAGLIGCDRGIVSRPVSGRFVGLAGWFLGWGCVHCAIHKMHAETDEADEKKTPDHDDAPEGGDRGYLTGNPSHL
jgi:hypothetical protein